MFVRICCRLHDTVQRISYQAEASTITRAVKGIRAHVRASYLNQDPNELFSGFCKDRWKASGALCYRTSDPPRKSQYKHRPRIRTRDSSLIQNRSIVPLVCVLDCSAPDPSFCNYAISFRAPINKVSRLS